MSVNTTLKKGIACALLLVFALLSFFVIADQASSPEAHQASIDALDEKKITVVELTAATAVGATALALVPGDATNPIANQIAKISSYLTLVVGAIMLEKFLLTFTGLLAFRYLLPLACLLAAVYLFFPREALKRLAAKLAVFSLCICLVIPISIQVSNLFEETFQAKETIDETIAGLEESEDLSPEEEKETGLSGWLSQAGDKLSSSAGSLMEKAKLKLSNTIDAVAVLLIANLAIPILIPFLFLWLIKLIFGLQINPPKQFALPRKSSAAEKAASPESES